MTINWIPCSDRIPPDDENLYIFRTWTDSGPIVKLTGIRARKELCFTNLWEWIPYDEETWKEVTVEEINAGRVPCFAKEVTKND